MIRVLICLFSLTALERAGAFEPRVRLLNGDRLSGNYVRQSGGVSFFKVPWRDEPVAVPSRFVGSVVLSATEEPPNLPARITLHNGDRFRADLLELNDDMLVCKTSWAPRLEFPVNRVEGIDFPFDGERLLYQGPGPLADWRISGMENAKLESGAVTELPDGLVLSTSATSVTLKRTLPPVSGAFALEWRLDSSIPHNQYTFAISGISGNDGEQLTYNFMVSSQVLYYRLTGKNHRSQDTWRLISRNKPLIQSGANRFRFEVDPDSGQLAFWLGEVRLNRWRDEHLPRRKVESLQPEFSLRVTRQNGITVFDSIRLAAIPAARILENGTEDAPEAAATFTRAVLRNGDMFDGDLVDVNRNSVFLRHAATGRMIELPSNRLEYLFLPVEDRVLPRRHNRDVVLRANRGGDLLTVQLLDADVQQVMFRMDGLDDTQRFPMAQVEKLIFNPYLAHRLDTEPFREKSGIPLTE